MISLNPESVDLSKLMDWYSAHCDGDWEHSSGVSIETLDNPGWLLKVNLIGTNLADVEMPDWSEGCDEDSHTESSPWISCSVQGGEFVGASDPSQLPRLISVFNALIDAVPR